MKCFKCGAEIPAGKMACEKCGAIVFGGQTANMTANGTTGSVSNETPRLQQFSGEPGGSGFSVASMVLGILSLVFCWLPIFSIPMGIVATALGGIAIYRQNSGRGMAIAGLTCAIIALAFDVLLIIIAGGVLGALS